MDARATLKVYIKAATDRMAEGLGLDLDGVLERMVSADPSAALLFARAGRRTPPLGWNGTCPAAVALAMTPFPAKAKAAPVVEPAQVLFPGGILASAARAPVPLPVPARPRDGVRVVRDDAQPDLFALEMAEAA